MSEQARELAEQLNATLRGLMAAALNAALDREEGQ
jgi:hypothetical protein